MSSIVDTLFGGTDKSSLKSQKAANLVSQQFTRDQLAQARGDTTALFPGADINRNLGFQGAFDVLGQTVPQQFSTIQQGNVGAQQALIGGLPQIQNALLG